MHVAGSNRLFSNPGDTETLMARMGRGRDRPAGAEDREVSSDSVEEITEEDFSSRFPPSSSSNPRFWMGDHPVRFPVMGRNYVTNLSNFAWAQAVQNKPLGFEGMSAVGSDGRVGGKASSEEVVLEVTDSSSSSNNEELGGQMEEEGELEEGEIDSEASGIEMVGDNLEEIQPVKTEEKMELLEEEETKKEPPEKGMEEVQNIKEHVASNLEDLDTITAEDAEKSFEVACSRLQKTLDRLQQMVAGCRIPVDALVQQAFAGVKTVHSVFLKRKERRKDALSRLLSHVKNQAHTLFKPDQLEEVNVMMQSMVSEAVDKEIEGKPHLEQISVNSTGSTSGRAISYFPKLPKLEPLICSKNRVEYYPLLDPCAKYDEDNLPSPTRESVQPLPTLKSFVPGGVAVIPLSATCKKDETEDAKLHPYITDALKAVSSYQQKYLRTSFVPSNELPSPTPSEECKDDDEGSHGEVSSSSIVGSVRVMNSSFPLQSLGSSSITACTEASNGQGPLLEVKGEHESFKPKQVGKASAKSRDPRLRFANPEIAHAVDVSKENLPSHNNVQGNGLTGRAITNPRKHNVSHKDVLGINKLKRQRDGILSKDLHMSSGRGGWLEENCVLAAQPSDRSQLMETGEVKNRKLENGDKTNVKNEQMPLVNSSPIVSFPSLLKDIAVNPTMLMHLIKEQQKLEVEAQQKTSCLLQDAQHPASTNRLLGEVSSARSIPLLITKSEQKSTEKPQMPTMNLQNDAGKIRMKPRDPRRILHNNMLQNGEKLVSEQLKASVPCLTILKSKDSSTAQEQGEQPQTATLPSQSTPLPDIVKQFTKNLKNVADIMSTAEVTDNQSAAPQSILQTMPTKMDKMDVSPVATELNNQPNISVVTQEGSKTGVTLPSNPWGDVDHLLDGYDDQQKATIQLERVRRIEEQNKMFAARKLCLVLDLDHTLLNSAKFVEVDPVHDEVLRKKEEQDREKPQRHLFRFQHLGMWTKLRPGIWNFLEKASKIYELHLYTMGNKLYATEMAKVLDPTGTLFAGRVISKGDDGNSFDGDERLPKSKDLDGVLGMESAVVIIDDSVRVWPHHRLNLIVVERYTYFPCSRWQFGLPGPSLLEIDHDERPEDGTLASSLAVIERIYHHFFSHHCLNDVDVRNILASEQRKILSGCRIVFSRIFPVGEANPHLHPLWQTAEQFGAVCTSQIDDKVTHVVANSRGTDKVNWALSTGRFVVHPGWVEASALLYRRANEHDFAVKI